MPDAPVANNVLTRSVETLPTKDQAPQAVSDSGWGILSFITQGLSEIPAWGTLVQRRDAMLRELLPTEPFAAGAFASVISRYASFSWTLKGPNRPRTTAAAQQMLLSANLGRGWVDYAAQLAMDLLTSDKGAFTELIRAADSPDSPVIGIRALNTLQCWATGNPEIPVIFWDQFSGEYRKLKWYQVHHLREIPMISPLIGRGRVYDLQLCALSRVLLHMKAYRSTLEYLEEKTSGRHQRAIHVISGVGKNQLDDALAMQEANADAKLLKRYIQPTVVSSISPDAKLAVATLDLATLPDAFKPEELLKQYLTCLSLGLLTDYQELAPLPGGALGSGQQSTILDKKSKSKGAGIWRKLIAHMMNQLVLPDGIEFEFDEQDLDEDQAAALARETRAKGRALMKANGEVDAMGARQIALDDGDVSSELFEAMQQRDLTEEKIRDDEREKIARERILATGTPAGVPAEVPATAVSPAGNVVSAGTAGTVVASGEKPSAGVPGLKASREAFEDQIGTAEDEAASLIEKRLARVYRSLQGRLEGLE